MIFAIQIQVLWTVIIVKAQIDLLPKTVSPKWLLKQKIQYIKGRT